MKGDLRVFEDDFFFKKKSDGRNSFREAVRIGNCKLIGMRF